MKSVSFCNCFCQFSAQLSHIIPTQAYYSHSTIISAYVGIAKVVSSAPPQKNFFLGTRDHLGNVTVLMKMTSAYTPLSGK